MNAGELLDELRRNILRDNSSLVAGDDDRLWSDDTLMRYINEGYRRFAKRTLMIRDGSTPEFTQVPLQDGVTLYQLNPVVLTVRSLKYHEDVGDLPRMSHQRLDTSPRATEDTYWDVNTVSSMAPGRPQTWTTDEELRAGPDTSITLRVYPTPSATEAGNVLYLRVSRLPANSMSLDDTEALPEIPEDYHLDMLHWAAYRAYSNHDVDGGDSAAATKHKEAFEACVLEATRDAHRRTFATMGFAVGRGPFSWAR